METFPITPVDPGEFTNAVPLWVAMFLTRLVVVPMQNGRDWFIGDTFNFESQVLQRILTIVRGTLTDFASVPRFLWWIWPPTGWYARAAALHDGLCRDRSIPCTFEQAAWVFREAMDVLVAGSSGWHYVHVAVSRECLYLGVRCFGRSSFQPRAIITTL